jgi:uncharacterized protein (TIRG00374 family)
VRNFSGAVDDLRDVRVSLLLVAVALQGGALLAYSNSTRAALGPAGLELSMWRLLRIQMSTRAFGGVVPGGAAVGPALGFRLLTRSGVSSRDAGFALGAAGIVSAVVLNLVLWAGLVVSIPLHGFNRLYIAAAAVGLFTISFFAMMVVGLIRGDRRIERPVRWIVRRLRRDENKAVVILRDLGDRLARLLRDRKMLLRVGGWALLNWSLDALSLWVFLRAFGASIGIDALLVSFGIANVLAAIPISPSGIGIVEWTYITMLVGFGLPVATATLGVTAYRFGHVLLPLPIGGLLYASLRFGPWSIERSEARRVRRVTRSMMPDAGHRGHA